jgi:hypothetical protein
MSDSFIYLFKDNIIFPDTNISVDKNFFIMI